MKNTLALLVSIVLVTSYSAVAQHSSYQKGHHYCCEKKSNQEHTPDLPMLSPNSPKHSYDVLNYAMELDLMNNYSPPYPASFIANIIVKFRVDSTLNAINLNAVNSSLVIDSVRMAGTSFTHLANVLTVTLDRTYFPGEIAEVKIYYRHNNVNDGAIYVSGGFLFTDCEPEGARKWFPCWDKPSDKATVDIKAKVPQNVKLGSNGRLQDSIPGTNSITYHWISRDPVATYLVVLTSKVDYLLDIVNWTNPNTGEVVPIRFYYNPMESPYYIQSIIGEMTTFFSDRFGDHPFEKNGFATLNNQFAWGGMENQTLTSLCPGCWTEWLVAHEFAHQWFGDMITCATWADLFLNEGFATWTEAHWTEYSAGYNAYKDEMEGNAAYYLSANPGWPISDPSWAINTPGNDTLFNYAITYMKGSCVLHQLRYVLGDSTYFAALKSYATDTVDFKYQSATIQDFKTKIETVTGQELDWFFDSWIYTANHPTYKNVYQIKAVENEKWQVTFTARQQQAALNYWQMPLELKINFLNLTDTIIRVFNSYNGQIFTFLFDHQPANLVFDPNNDILLKQGNTIVSDGESIIQPISASVSPSPFSNHTVLRYHLDQPSPVKIKVVDLSGRNVLEKSFQSKPSGSHEQMIRGEDLKPGIYFLHLETEASRQVLRIVRQ